MTITEVYGNAPPDAFICAISAHIAEKMKEDAEHEHLGAAGGRIARCLPCGKVLVLR